MSGITQFGEIDEILLAESNVVVAAIAQLLPVWLAAGAVANNASMIIVVAIPVINMRATGAFTKKASCELGEQPDTKT